MVKDLPHLNFETRALALSLLHYFALVSFLYCGCQDQIFFKISVYNTQLLSNLKSVVDGNANTMVTWIRFYNLVGELLV